MSQEGFARFPMTLPGGGLLPHMSARRRTELVDALFEGAGGFDKAKAWIEASDDNYGEFFKIWAKGAARHTNIELGVSDGVESFLERLDRADKAKTIDGEAVEVLERT